MLSAASTAAVQKSLSFLFQVAETFDMDLDKEMVKSLKGKAYLDNCVTVLDAAELLNNLASISSLKVRV